MIVRPSFASEREAALAGAVGEGRDAAVVLVAGAVEDHALDARRLGPLGDELADALGLGGLVTLEAAQVGLHRAGVGQRAADTVVDHLCGDVLRGAGDHQARTLGGAGETLAPPDLATQTRGHAAPGVLALLERDGHRHLPAFPTLRRT